MTAQEPVKRENSLFRRGQLPLLLLGGFQLAAQPLFLFHLGRHPAAEQEVDHRGQEQRRDGGEAEAADDDPTESDARLGACALS